MAIEKTKTTKQLLKLLNASTLYREEFDKVCDSLERLPILRGLLENYVLRLDEEHSDTEIGPLAYTYIGLKKRNMLGDLFKAEHLKETGDFIGSEWL